MSPKRGINLSGRYSPDREVALLLHWENRILSLLASALGTGVRCGKGW